MGDRTATIERKTAETEIKVVLNLDGDGTSRIDTGIGFFDHMLTQIARHGLVDLTVEAEGDLHIDPHHTVEDVGICIGQALAACLAKPEGIVRYGHGIVPMDEVLAEAVLDVSGRPFFVFDADLPRVTLGGYDVELTEEFMRALAINARVTLHLMLRRGGNSHHCVEGLFKAFARALRSAVTVDPRVKGVPSSKGMLQT
jgi:imidazoleglycerol-phosphate dehydratase